MAQISLEHLEIAENGDAKLVGSRIKVKHIIALKKALGYTAEQIQQEAYPHLSLSQIYAALAYYHDHQDEVDAVIERDDATYQVERQKQESDQKYQELIAKIRDRAGKL